ncbi:MAG: YeeE/YedE family protein [Alphaproteobacteria bacterium]
MESSAALLPLAGLAIGAAFGAATERSGFCTMGAVSDWAGLGDATRLRAWALAAAIAIAGAQALHLAGAIDLSLSMHGARRVAWLGNLVGGALFGVGMTYAGGCASRSLARLGAGNLKSLVVLLVLAVAAMATMRGLLAPMRLAIVDGSAIPLPAPQAIPELLAPGSSALRAAIAAIIASALAAWALLDPRLRARRALVAGASAAGTLAGAAWAATGILGRDDFDPAPLASLSFVAPVAETTLYAMLSTGSRFTFAVATCVGVVAGATTSALAAGRFRWEGFADRDDLVRHVLGGAAMGIGGVLAMGCTIGQGLAGISTLALGSVLSIAGILAGGALATRALAEGSWREVLRLR